jgi:PRC-barrel domain
MKLRLTMLLLAGTALSSPAFAQTQTTAAMQPSLADCDSAMTVLDQNKSADTSVTRDQIKALRVQKNAQGCHDILLRVDPSAAQRAAQTSDRDAQPGAATVKVEQASPQVTVAQAQPDVNVTQGTPQIFVHQPAPTVTIDIPQPEITVKMPKPGVNVAMAQPQVDVTQAKPQVKVVQPSEPQVQVESGQPKVSVQRSANAQPNVTVEGSGQPQVHYDRAEPKVVINQAKGQPQIKVEKTDAVSDTATNRMATDTSADDKSASTADSTNRPSQQMTVGRINSLNLYNANGDNLGDVEHVIMGKDDQPHIVIGNGGFFGIGEKQVAIPLEQTALHGDRLVIRGLSDDQVRAMPTWTTASGDRELAKDKTLAVTTVR